MKKSKNIYVIGVFDLFHYGHIELLRKAKNLGEKLIVAINGDEMVTSYKRKPIFSENERLELIKACKYVDEAFIINDYDNRDYLIKHQIDVVVHGNDWEEESYKKQIRVTDDFLEKHSIELALLPYTSGVSTSNIIRQIKASN